MANTTEMIRIMRHAAALLDNCDPKANAIVIGSISTISDVKSAAMHRAAAEMVALGTASAVLRMVAAALDDEPDPLTEQLGVKDEELNEKEQHGA